MRAWTYVQAATALRGLGDGPDAGPVASSERRSPTARRAEGGRCATRASTDAVGEPLSAHEVRGGDGLRLHVREWGDPQGPPIVLVHGWSQSQLCWSRQVAGALAEDFRLVTFDLRGHGMSEKPLDAEAYLDARLWADDLAVVIEEVAPDRPMLVAWSYGGFVVTDYLRAYGEEGIAGVNLVGSAVLLQPGFDHIGPGLLENASDACVPDLATNIAAIRRFLSVSTAQPLSADDSEHGAVREHGRAPRGQRRVARARDRRRRRPLAGCPCRCWSRTDAPTRSCCRPWPSTCSTSAARPRPPGTRTSDTCRSSRIPSGSTASWASS